MGDTLTVPGLAEFIASRYYRDFGFDTTVVGTCVLIPLLLVCLIPLLFLFRQGWAAVGLDSRVYGLCKGTRYTCKR